MNSLPFSILVWIFYDINMVLQKKSNLSKLSDPYLQGFSLCRTTKVWLQMASGGFWRPDTTFLLKSKEFSKFEYSRETRRFWRVRVLAKTAVFGNVSDSRIRHEWPLLRPDTTFLMKSKEFHLKKVVNFVASHL